MTKFKLFEHDNDPYDEERWDDELKKHEVPEDQEYFHINHYHCDECDISWEDRWDAMCDDDCPKCGKTYTPEQSDEILGDINDDVPF